jgi:L-ascorbate metabolism protein UlaG (beta-lactamase superfamily)
MVSSKQMLWQDRGGGYGYHLRAPAHATRMLVRSLNQERVVNLNGIQLTWLGHATFRVQTPEGKTIYIDPWIAGNPMCPESEKNVKKADVLLCTHGHGDHIGDAVDVGKKLDPLAVGIYELCLWLQKKGVKQISPMNKGAARKRWPE